MQVREVILRCKKREAKEGELRWGNNFDWVGCLADAISHDRAKARPCTRDGTPEQRK